MTTNDEAKPRPGMTCGGCGARVPTVPLLGTPLQCECGIVYTATVDAEALYRRTRDMARIVAQLEDDACELRHRLSHMGPTGGR